MRHWVWGGWSPLENVKGQIESCDTCNMCKSHRESFKPINKISSKGILELLHLDIWEPAPVESIGGSKYFMSVIDDFSRFSTVYFLKHKNEAFEYFKQYQTEMERQTGKKIKRIRTDNGMEFCAYYFEENLENQGIRVERTNPYSLEMNGIAERFNRTIIEGVRTLLYQGNLSKALWAELGNTQNYLKNRFPHRSLGGKVPGVLKRTD